MESRATWVNSDTAPHTVTSKSVPSSASAFDSGNMNAGAKFSYTFTVSGTYTYYCQYHFWMQGTVIVVAP
ncbi:MAG TPA: plastocyanin/azurin family copper-binding protein [Candidatus Angelobacter sp.]|nr:plastocyanin/azurin family copper-binding protein [Candidatus Angelobacter sp.]